jgi:hypothetical protein
MLKNPAPLSSSTVSIAYLLYPLSAERAVGQTGPYRIVLASDGFIGDLDQSLLGNLDQVIRPGHRGARRSRAWRILALRSEESLDGASIYGQENVNVRTIGGPGALT